MGMFDCRPRREYAGEKAAWISRHEYDPASGWCAWSCGCRNDGRVVNRDGKVINRGPVYTSEQIENFREYLAHRFPPPSRPAPRPEGLAIPELAQVLERPMALS